ncbi:TetR family transcriptional regulator [Plantactinospora mayteni]|uniref:TetR family transcriptional regulator n=1 Tax=Plantactinospora mayteni TaxID=566021 RepID=A0ABQ4EY67_9ACTN|nr:TetR family transcriptional regulator [Plantactinospora mayteni]GIG99605.1 TetR family transcriptional regulator [Plantactinospora mayteni]
MYPGVGPASATAGESVRDRLARAAFELFADQGYESTTIDDITAAAGVARRTFFRHFPSKDDVIFPDHDSVLDRVRWYLGASANAEPVFAVAEATRLIFESFIATPQQTIARYRLTREAAALRDREIASVARYERVLSDYLRSRLPDTSAAALAAHVAAASFVAAHNQVLREWLRSGGTEDPRPALEAAVATVSELITPLITRNARRDAARAG